VIPVNIPDVAHQDLAAVEAALRAGYLSGHTEVVTGFEEALAGRVGTTFAVAVSSGSAALELACEIAEIQPGDEVVLPAFTIMSCLAPVLRRGARPVFVDSRPGDWNMAPDQALGAITPLTRAIIAVHTYGLGLELDTLHSAISDAGGLLIEDAAESLGVRVNGRECGSLGHVGVHSFYANKVITGGEGGALTLDNVQIYRRLRALRNLDFGAVDRFSHQTAAWNLRMSSLQAALVHSQLTRLDHYLAHRLYIADAYRERLAHLPGITFQNMANSVSRCGHWVVALLIDEDTGVDAKRFGSELADVGVESRPFFTPLNRQPVLAKYGLEQQPAMPVAERLARQGLYLPFGNGIDLTTVERVCQHFQQVHQRLISSAP